LATTQRVVAPVDFPAVRPQKALDSSYSRARHQHAVFMSVPNEDAPASDGNNRAYITDLREMFIHVCAEIAPSIARARARAFPRTGIQEMDIAILNSGFTWRSAQRPSRE